jgi:hypothetical protein
LKIWEPLKAAVEPTSTLDSRYAYRLKIVALRPLPLQREDRPDPNLCEPYPLFKDSEHPEAKRPRPSTQNPGTAKLWESPRQSRGLTLRVRPFLRGDAPARFPVSLKTAPSSSRPLSGLGPVEVPQQLAGCIETPPPIRRIGPLFLRWPGRARGEKVRVRRRLLV